MNVPLSVSYENASGVYGSWIGLYQSDAGDGDYLRFEYIDTSTQGSVIFTDEFASGYYNFRMFQGAGYDKIATSKTFLVRQGMVLDTDFGQDGFFTWNPSPENRYNRAKAVRRMSDGSVMVAGEMKTGITSSDGYEEVSILLINLNADGVPVDNFGNAGYVNQVISSSFSQLYLTEVTALAIQDNGKMVIGGNAIVYFSNDDLAQLAVIARFNRNGTLDETFGDKGIEMYAFKYPGDDPVDSYLRFLEITSDGKILAGGGSIRYQAFAPGWPAMIRVWPNGMLDNSFGGTGVQLYTDSIFWRGFVESVQLNPDNTFYAVITAVAQFGKNHQILYKINSDGSPDVGFGQQGFSILHDPVANNDWSSTALLRHASGGLNIVGQNGSWGIWSTLCSSVTGEIVSTYGDNGFMHTIPNPLGSLSIGNAVLQGQHIDVAYMSLERRMSMSRIGTNGQLDAAFGHSFLELKDVDQSFIRMAVSDLIHLDDESYLLVGNGYYPASAHWESMVIAFRDNPEIILSVSGPGVSTPVSSLEPVYPNPCSNECTYAITVTEDSDAIVELFTVAGIRLGEVFRGTLSPGQHVLQLAQDLDVHAGVYILRVSVTNRKGQEVSIGKFVKL